MAATPRLDIIVNHVMFTEDACWMKRNGTLNLTSPPPVTNVHWTPAVVVKQRYFFLYLLSHPGVCVDIIREEKLFVRIIIFLSLPHML